MINTVYFITIITAVVVESVTHNDMMTQKEGILHTNTNTHTNTCDKRI